MTTVAPAPTKWLVGQIVNNFTSAVVSGIVPDRAHLDDGGYHVSIEDLVRYGNAGDYSNRKPLDKAPPVTPAGRKNAAAHDISLSKADMRRMYGNVRKVWLNRATDSRAKYINAINVWSTVAGERPTRFNFTAGTSEPASKDHEWHEHTDQPRVYVDTAYNDDAAWRAARAVLSTVTGQTHTAWQQQEKLGAYAPKPPAPPAPPSEDDDPMITSSYQLPDAYGYDSDGKPLLDGQTLTVATPPAGHAGHSWGKTRKLYLSLSGDHMPDDGADLRVAIHDGNRWHVQRVTVKAGARQDLTVPKPATQTAYNITVGRVYPAPPAPPPADADPDTKVIELPQAFGSIALLVEML